MLLRVGRFVQEFRKTREENLYSYIYSEIGSWEMDRKGSSEVEVASLPGASTGGDITNFNTCLILNKDTTGIVGNPSFSIRLDNDIIVSEILSRLPEITYAV